MLDDICLNNYLLLPQGHEKCLCLNNTLLLPQGQEKCRSFILVHGKTILSSDTPSADYDFTNNRKLFIITSFIDY